MQTALFNKRNELLLNLEKKKNDRWDEKNNNNSKKSDLKKEFEELKNRVNNIGNERRRSEVKLWGNEEEEKVGGSSSRGVAKNSSRMKGEREKSERKSLNLLVSEQSSTIPTPTSSYRKPQNNVIVDATFSFKKIQDTLQKLIFSKLSHLSSRITNIQQLIPSLHLSPPPCPYSLKHYQLTISQLQHSNKSLLSHASSLQSQLQSLRLKYQSQRSYYLHQLQSLLQKSTTNSKSSQQKYSQTLLQHTNTIQSLQTLLLSNQQSYLKQSQNKNLKISQQKQQIQKLSKTNLLLKINNSKQQTKLKQQINKKQQEIQIIKQVNKRLEQQRQKFINKVNIQINKLLNDDIQQKEEQKKEEEDRYGKVLKFLGKNVEKEIKQKQQFEKVKEVIGREVMGKNMSESILKMYYMNKQLQKQIQQKRSLIQSKQQQYQQLQSTISSLQTITIPTLQSQLLSITSQNKQLHITISSLQSSLYQLQQSIHTLQNSKQIQINQLLQQCSQKSTKILYLSQQYQKYKQQNIFNTKLLCQKNKQLQTMIKEFENKYQEQMNKWKIEKKQFIEKCQKCEDELERIKGQKVYLQQKLLEIEQEQGQKKRLKQQQLIIGEIKKKQEKDQQILEKVDGGMRICEDFKENVNKEFDMLGDYNNSENFDIGEVEVKRGEQREITDFFLKMKYGIEKMIQGEEVEVDVPREIEKEYRELMEMIEERVGKEWSVIEGWEESREIGDSMMEGLVNQSNPQLSTLKLQTFKQFHSQ